MHLTNKTQHQSKKLSSCITWRLWVSGVNAHARVAWPGPTKHNRNHYFKSVKNCGVWGESGGFVNSKAPQWFATQNHGSPRGLTLTPFLHKVGQLSLVMELLSCMYAGRGALLVTRYGYIEPSLNWRICAALRLEKSLGDLCCAT